jgi:hypothetical protein
MTETTPIDPEKRFVVVLKGHHHKVAWGPFDGRPAAEEFAEFVTAKIDPAEVRTLSSPVGELLAWHKSLAEQADVPGEAEDYGCGGCTCCSAEECYRGAYSRCPTDSLGDSICPCTEPF